MPLNPNIPLSVESINPLHAIAQSRDVKRRGLENQALEQDMDIRAQEMEQRSLIDGAIQLNEFLKAGDIEGAKRFSKSRETSILARGGNARQTQDVIERLEAGDIEGLQSDVNAILALTGNGDATPAAVQEFYAKAQAAGLEPGTPEFMQAAKVSFGLEAKAAAPTNLGKLISERDSLPEGDPRRTAYDAAIAKATTHNPSTNVNVNTADNSFSKEFGKVNAKQFFERRQSALDAAGSLEGIAEAKTLLDSGVITGAGADVKVTLGKGLQAIGFNVAEDAIANSEAFVAAQAKQVANIIKAFGAGTGLSDADREFAIKAAAGDINLTERSIRRILDINDRASRNVIERYNKDASFIDPNMSPFPLQIETPSPSNDIDDLVSKYAD